MNPVGKYDKECCDVLKKAKAKGALVIVLQGRYGDGFSASFEPGWADKHVLGIPDLLRAVAAQIERDIRVRGLN